MAGTRKRKHAAHDNADQQTVQGIKAFGAVSKPKDHQDGVSKKRRTAARQESTPPPLPQKQAAMQQDKKRKRAADQEEDNESASNDNVFKRSAKQRETSALRGERSKGARPPTPAETPSKDTAALFDKLRLGSDARAIPFSFNPPKLPDTPPRTPEADYSDLNDLPSELQELVSLHSAFLSALSLYYSHNGTSSPVDVKALMPMITKSWRKRTVTLDDLRRLLGLEARQPALKLQDFGRAGVCLTEVQPRGRATKRAASFVDEENLNANFENALATAWAGSQAANTSGDPSAFVSRLPLVDITKDESVEKTAPMFARGHQRLAELKAGQAAAIREPTPTPDAQIQQKTPLATQNRGTNLLDRILAKQAHTASLPAGPTREQLERKAALHRIEDIARVLDLLAAGRARCSYSMPAMVQQLQQSLRNPISREEVERCLDLMAKEIMPGFVGLVKNGAVTGVVVTRGGRVGLEVLKERIVSATA